MTNLPLPDAWVSVSRAALRHNVGALWELLAQSPTQQRVIAVVKADAYGHGAVETARVFAAAGVDFFAVTTLEEALALREAGIAGRVLVFLPPRADQIPAMVEAELDITLMDETTCAAVADMAERQSKTAQVHLKVDTGMGRVGVLPTNAITLAQSITAAPRIAFAGIYTHFARALEANPEPTRRQFARFQEVLSQLEVLGIDPGLRHCANSAALLRFPEMRLDAVRPGTILYGQYPSASVPRDLELRDGWRLQARIAAVRDVPAGSALGYGGEFTTKRPTRLAILPIGYADGFTVAPASESSAARSAGPSPTADSHRARPSRPHRRSGRHADMHRRCDRYSRRFGGQYCHSPRSADYGQRASATDLRRLMRIALTISLLLLLCGSGWAQPPLHPFPAREGTGLRSAPVTTYPHMVAELRADARHSPWVRLAAIGKSHDGRTLWLARVIDPSISPAKTLRLMVLFRQHGDEPAPTEAALGLLRAAAAGQYHPPPGVALYLVPMVNPDGAAAGTRVNGVGADLNRDWGVFSQPETRAVARAVRQVRPQILVDAHNWDPSDPFNANCLEVSRDLGTPLARATAAIQKQEIGDLKRAGFSVDPTSYDQNADPHLAHRWFASQGIASLLVETHSGSPQDTANYQRRQQMYINLIKSLARHDAGQRNWLNTVEKTRFGAIREAALFPLAPTASVREAGANPPARKPLRWLWTILAYGAALFAAFLSGGIRSWKAQTAESAPASGMRSESRRDKPRYRYSPSVRALRPAPAGYGRKR
jgi:alanine racemase